MGKPDNAPIQFSVRQLLLVISCAAVVLSIVAGYRRWKVTRIPFNPSRVDRFVVTGNGLWGDGERSATVDDKRQVRRFTSLLKRSSAIGLDAGGLDWLSVTVYDGDKKIGHIWVGDYAEWGYDGHIQGYSHELQRMLIEILYKHPNAVPRKATVSSANVGAQ